MSSTDSSEDGLILSLRGLTVTRSTSCIVDAADFSVGPGEWIHLTGPNGSGKSTVLEAFIGLFPSRAISRHWLGREGAPTAHEALRDGSLAYLPQFENVFASLSLRENIFLGCRLTVSESKRRFQRACELFPEMCRALASLPAQTSGGQRQMAAITRTLMRPFSLMVLDEPTAGLSLSGTEAAYTLIEELAPRDCAVLFTEHGHTPEFNRPFRTLSIKQQNLMLETLKSR